MGAVLLGSIMTSAMPFLAAYPRPWLIERQDVLLRPERPLHVLIDDQVPQDPALRELYVSADDLSQFSEQWAEMLQIEGTPSSTIRLYTNGRWNHHALKFLFCYLQGYQCPLYETELSNLLGTMDFFMIKKKPYVELLTQLRPFFTIQEWIELSLETQAGYMLDMIDNEFVL